MGSDKSFGMSNCCETSVPQPDSSFETFARPVADWQARLTAGLTRSVQASDETLGHLEEAILHSTRDLERKLLEAAAQKKADQSPPVCPVCGHKLSRRTREHARTFQSRFGPVTANRLRGFALGAGNGGPDGEQNAGHRSQRGD